MVLLLAACSDASNRWSKPGVSPETASADLDGCESEAHQATRRQAQIDADILASRGNDWQRTGTLTAHRDDMAASNRYQADRIIASCMAGKGYSPVRR